MKISGIELSGKPRLLMLYKVNEVSSIVRKPPLMVPTKRELSFSARTDPMLFTGRLELFISQCDQFTLSKLLRPSSVQIHFTSFTSMSRYLVTSEVMPELKVVKEVQVVPSNLFM